MASTSVHRAVRNEENVGAGIRNAKSADAQSGAKPARKALGDLTNNSRTPLSRGGKTAKKSLSQSKQTSMTSAASSSKRKRSAKVDLENPPEVERMIPFKEKPEAPRMDKEVLDAAKGYRTDFASLFFAADPILSGKKEISLPADVADLFGPSASDDTQDEEVKLHELYQESAVLMQEAQSIGSDLDPNSVDLDQLLDDLNLF